MVKVERKDTKPHDPYPAAIHWSVSGKVAKIDTAIDASGYPKPRCFTDMDGDEWEESPDEHRKRW